MSPFVPLDTTTAMLDGVNLIEANAGTGKTYSIASLYTRLVAMQGLSVDQVLVVSFTEAATAELQERIRGRLASLRRALLTGRSDDAHEASMIEAVDDAGIAARRVERALQSFDEAAIHTIHGFCQRLLAETAFEAGFGFEAELITDDGSLRRQLVDDFWRVETASGSRGWLETLYIATSPAKLVAELGTYFSRPGIRRIVPPAPSAASETQLEVAFTGLVDAVCKAWPADREAAVALLGQRDVMNQASYGPAQLAGLVAAADSFVELPVDRLSALSRARLGRLGTAAIASKIKKGQRPPQHPIFELWQALADAGVALQALYDQKLAVFRARLIEFAETQLPQRKHSRRVRHFDDLLNDVYAALAGPQSAALGSAVQGRYKAALIDEFQDTDPVQFAIFERLFCSGDVPVFFVGDPKQAIYSFRNADVYAYLEARDQAQRAYRLDINYRSAPELVDAVNALFGRSNEPFALDRITYAPSQAQVKSQRIAATTPPMQWWVIEPVGGKRPNASDARRQVAEATATSIVQLLSQAQRGVAKRPDGNGGGVALQARDIAVLTRTHDEGALVRRALARRGVGSVQRSGNSVFGTFEADELTVVLAGVARCNDQRAARAALATEMLGFDAHALEALSDDDQAWQHNLDILASLRARWVRQGFAPMHRALLREFDVERRLLGLVDGQRRLTNVLHLEDLLQRESSHGQRSPEELLSWLQGQREGRAMGEDTTLLRLESDENLVQIQTIHFAKGLQYPVVFCPFLWSARPNRKENVAVFHDDDGVCLDVGSADFQRNQEQNRDEIYAESLRLAYVALTRAQYACVAVWGSVAGAQFSPLAWLLHSQPGDTRTDLVGRVRALDHAELVAPLRALASDDVEVVVMPEPDAKLLSVSGRQADLAARVLARAVPQTRRVSSFSALARSHAEQPRDYDALAGAQARAVAATADGIAGFPRGARAGRCIHSLFEHVAFDADAQTITDTAASMLVRHGFDTEHAAVLTRMVEDVVHTPLDEVAPWTLAQVRHRVDEMEFYFPTAGLDAAALRTALGDFDAGSEIAARLAALDFQIVDGYFHGFIDLVCEWNGRYYLVDYKSNWLGDTTGAYRRDKLGAEIARHDYYLQYLIYSVALHRYLRSAVDGYDYETHFGGALYLFVRGMHPSTGAAAGVFHDRADARTLTALEQALCEGTQR